MNLYCYSEINKILLSHNNLLKEVNSVLVKTIEDLLNSNLEICNKLNIILFIFLPEINLIPLKFFQD